MTRDGAIDEQGPDTKLQNVTDWYKRHFLVDLTQFPQWPVVNELRLVANTTKHAEGSSAEDLRLIRPELFQNPIVRNVGLASSPVMHIPVSLPLGGDGLYVTNDDFHRYQTASAELFEWLIEYFEKNGEEYYPH